MFEIDEFHASFPLPPRFTAHVTVDVLGFLHSRQDDGFIVVHNGATLDVQRMSVVVDKS